MSSITDTYEMSGSLTSQPAVGSPSGAPGVAIPIDTTLTLIAQQVGVVDLASDAPVSLSFGGVTNAHVLFLSVVEKQTVKVTVTSADGATQIVPCNGILYLENTGGDPGSAPITAVTLTRSPGVDTTVTFFLGQTQ